MPQHHPAPIFEPSGRWCTFYIHWKSSNQIRSAPRYQSSLVMGHPPGLQDFCYVTMPKRISLRFPLASQSHPPLSPSYVTLEVWCRCAAAGRKQGRAYHIGSRPFTSWWFQPIWKVLVKMGIFPQIGVKIENIWNHHLVYLEMKKIRTRLKFDSACLFEGSLFFNPLFLFHVFEVYVLCIKGDGGFFRGSQQKHLGYNDDHGISRFPAALLTTSAQWWLLSSRQGHMFK